MSRYIFYFYIYTYTVPFLSSSKKKETEFLNYKVIINNNTFMLSLTILIRF